MRALKNTSKESTFQTIKAVAVDYSVSENTIRRYLKEMPAGVVRRFGRSMRINRIEFDKNMDILTATE